MMRFQRGIISGIEILVIVLVVAAFGAGAVAVVHTYNRTLTENANLKIKNEELAEAHQDQLVENAGLIARQELLNQQLAARQATDQRIAALERKFYDTFGQLLAQSPEARKWAATAIPDDVRRLLRQRAGAGPGGDQDKAGAAAAAVVKPDAGTGVPRSAQYQRRPAEVRSPVGVGGK